jgi:hypothetical protein
VLSYLLVCSFNLGCFLTIFVVLLIKGVLFVDLFGFPKIWKFFLWFFRNLDLDFVYNISIWVRSRTPQTVSVNSRIFLVFLKFENFLWFFRKADLDSVYTISILGEFENTSNGFCEKSNFSGFPEIWKFLWFFQEGRFGLGIYDFYSEWAQEHLNRPLWKVEFFLKKPNFTVL